MALRLNWLVATFLISSMAFLSSIKADEKVQFKKQKIQLVQGKNKKTILVEVAETPTELAQGLMFRKKLGPDQGMLFVFEDEQPREFWMKNTLIDLDIGYFDKEKKLIDIQQMKAVKSVIQVDIPSYPSKQPAMYALEMARAWFKKNKFTEGASFKFIVKPLSK